jgi:Metallo-peptidase family M12
MNKRLHRSAAALLLLALAQVSTAADIDAARFLQPGARHPDAVRVSGVQSGSATVTLELRRFEVFARDAELRVDDGHGNVQRLPRTRTRYYTGTVDGSGDKVFLAVEDDGRARGIVDGHGKAASLAAGPAQRLRLVPMDMAAADDSGGFHCDSDDLAQARAIVESAQAAPTQSAPGQARPRGQRPYRARAAIETDYQFFQKFTSAQQALDYVGDIIGYASTRYLSEIDTRLEIVFVRLWSSADDPWNETMTNCSLYEFGAYWNANMTGVSRSFAHMLSARTTGGGSAWVGGLCSTPFSAPIACGFGNGMLPVGGDYGFTGSLRANFNAGSPQPLWDSVSPAHEIGHNFNSPHTHCYGGIGGNADPIDRCYNAQTNCYAGATQLPGPAGSGSGTIMSYCHLLSPGFSNISMSFGTGHAYGVAPERVPARMSDYVNSLAQTRPACIVDETLFADGFD